MENAVDALKIGFAVIVFVMALSLTIYMFTEVRTAADAVLYSSDISEFIDYDEAVEGTEVREVGLETVIPTLYKYYKENFTVIFLDKSGNYLELYETQTNTALWSTDYINKYYGGTSTSICSFDVAEETSRHEPWTGSNEDYKEFLDYFISGEDYEYTDSSGNKTITFNNGRIIWI